MAVQVRLRTQSGQSNGYHNPTTNSAKVQQQKQAASIDAELVQFCVSQGKELLPMLADNLGVSVESLQTLGVGFHPDADTWTFPERTADGTIVGLTRRYQDGRKKMMKGHKHGLYFSDLWQAADGPILILEGGSDTAAAITLGLPAIGRPSALVPRNVMPELVKMVQWLSVDRDIIVVGENDQNSQHDNTKCPGKTGAIDTAQKLTEALGKPIRWAMPPSDAKDLRNWLQSNPGKTGADFVRSLVFEAKVVSHIREPSSEIDATDDAEFYLREKFSHDDGPTLRFFRNAFWGWKDNRWIELSNDQVRGDIALYLGERYLKVTTGAISNVLEFVRALSIVSASAAMPTWLDGRAGYSIAFKNGVAILDDLVSGKPDCLRKHSPQWFSEVVLPYEFQPNAQCEIWLDMLVKNLDSDCERGDLLQEFAGYCLSHSTEYHSMLMLTGDGGNGKSCVLAGISGMLGADNVSSLSLDELGEKFKLPRIVGKLANICADLAETSKACEGTLKKLISGDAMEFERKNRDPFTAIPTAKLLFSANTLPQFYDRSIGLWRRMTVMPFNRRVSEHEKVTGMDQPSWWLAKGELPGLFMWALRGLQRLLLQKTFTRSAVCVASLEEHRHECNNALSWLTEEYISDPGGEVARPDLYSAYSDFCRNSGLKPLGLTQFGKEVRKVFGQLDGTRMHHKNGGRVRFYKGIREKTEAEKTSDCDAW